MHARKIPIGWRGRATQHLGLRAGQLVFSGGVTAPVPVVAGGSVTFQFGGLGSIEVAGACRLGTSGSPDGID